MIICSQILARKRRSNRAAVVCVDDQLDRDISPCVEGVSKSPDVCSISLSGRKRGQGAGGRGKFW